MMNVPRTWATCEDKTANKIFSDVIQEAIKLGLIKGGSFPLYTFDSKRYYGWCRSEKVGDQYLSSIGLNKKILKSKDAILRVVIHEVAHAITPNTHHGGEFYRVGNQLGKKWHVQVHRVDDYSKFGVKLRKKSEIPVTKFIITCNKCGLEYRRSRASAFVNHPENFYCGRCKNFGDFEKIIVGK